MPVAGKLDRNNSTVKVLGKPVVPLGPCLPAEPSGRAKAGAAGPRLADRGEPQCATPRTV